MKLASRSLYILSVYIFSLQGNANAQVTWNAADSLFAPLPKGISVFRSTDSLNGRPFVGFYLIADLKNKGLNFTTASGEGQRYTPSQYDSMLNHPVVIVNGTFFSFQTNQNLNVLINEGEMKSYNNPALKSRGSDSFYYPTRSAIGITKGRRADVAWLFTDTAERWPYAFQENPVLAKGEKSDPAFGDLNTLEQWRFWKMQTAIGGGPVLLHEGQIRITNKEEQMFVAGEKDLHPRTAMGYTIDRRLIILVIEGRNPGIAEGATLKEEAEILQKLGCIEALNLDGGGSSCLLINGKQTIRPSDKQGQRAVPGVFVITTNKNVNKRRKRN